MTGSRRVSVNEEALPLLAGDFEPLIKLLTAAFLLCSSSIARLLLLRRNKKTPPAIAAIITIPTTTPAAMAALLGPPPEDLLLPDADEFGDAVVVTVSPPRVMTEGDADVVGELVGLLVDAGVPFELEEIAPGTFFASPSSQTV